jgi:DnaJ-class molecular chaperone
VESGTTLKVHGEGGEGPKGGRPGNLMLQIRVSLSTYFTRLGSLSELFIFLGCQVLAGCNGLMCPPKGSL